MEETSDLVSRFYQSETARNCFREFVPYVFKSKIGSYGPLLPKRQALELLEKGKSLFEGFETAYFPEGAEGPVYPAGKIYGGGAPCEEWADLFGLLPAELSSLRLEFSRGHDERDGSYRVARQLISMGGDDLWYEMVLETE